MSRPTEQQPLQHEEERRSKSFILANITLISRVLGIITMAVLWISTVVIIQDHKSSYVGYYLIAASTIVTFFELTWIADKSACCVREGCCCRVWAAIMWVDTWKKFILYIALSVPLFLEDMRLVLGVVSGFLLIILATFYLIKTFRSHISISYEKTERRVISSTTTPTIRTVRHEISTQTDTDRHVSTSYTIGPDETADGGSHRTVRHYETRSHYDSQH